MNLDELRDELTTRAAETDTRAADLLPGVRRKITHTKRRRVATTAGVIATAAAIAIGLLPGLTDTSTPQPSEPPPDYIKDGIRFPGVEGPDVLEKAWIGKPGGGPLDFSWTPSSNSVTFYVVCKSPSKRPEIIRVMVNGRHLTDGDCFPASSTNTSGITRILPDDGFWVDVPVGQPARVTASVLDAATKRQAGSSAQLALGIYKSPTDNPEDPGIPVRARTAEPGDYVKDGVRYRARIGGDTLAAAAVSDQSSLTLRFTATGAPLSLRDFCSANAGEYDDPPYAVSVRINNGVEHRSTCYDGSVDAGSIGGTTISDSIPRGRPIEIVARIVDKAGRPATVKGALLGLGVYFKGPQRIIEGSTTLDEVIESKGYTYKLATVATADAVNSREVSLEVPADKAMVIAAGSSDLGGKEVVQGSVDGLDHDDMGQWELGGDNAGFGVTTQAVAPGPARTATLKITTGKPTRGKLLIAIYLPTE